MEKSEIVQVAIIKFGFVVPLNFNPHAVFEVVDLVSWHVNLVAINSNSDVELAFGPALRVQVPIQIYRDLRSAASADHDRTMAKAKMVEASQKVGPFIGKIAGQDGGSVIPFLKSVSYRYLFGYEVERQ